MSITKNLVELMNGTITVKIRKDCGSTFTFTFTFRLSDEPDEGPETPESSDSRQFTGRRFLLAEDNELNQEIAATILEEAICTVDVTSDGAEAVEKILSSADDPYDLILIDIQMPVMDGIQATKTASVSSRPA